MKYPVKCPHCTDMFDSMDSVADSMADLRRHIENVHPGEDIPEVWFTTDDHGNRIELIRKGGQKRSWAFLVTSKDGVTAPVAVNIDKLDLMGLGMAVINQLKQK